MAAKKVFISYSHDSPEHAARVAGLAASLRRDGVSCRIDQYVEGSPAEGWPLWMERTIEWADIVLVVCTETYHRRVRKEEKPGKGHGATWEAHLIYLHLYEGNRLFNAKFLPVIFDPADKEFIPTPLRGVTHYRLDQQKGYDDLYVKLTGQHRPAPVIGQVKTVHQEQAPPLFGEPGAAATAAAEATLKSPRLKTYKDGPYPEQPYPLLRPYTHPKLFAGRDRELDELEKLLGDKIPILSLYSTSGAGKSSLLNAGLTPRLRKEGWPVAYTAYPKDRELARRLAGGLLEWKSDKTFSDDDPDSFREALRTAYALSRHPAILVLDQFEDVMEASAGEARERIGKLLTATVEEEPFCHWILSYRHEYHGQVEEWLQDAFRRADVTWRGRFQTHPLKPLGDAESAENSQRAFQAAIEAPLAIMDDDGQPLYGISFAEGGEGRLAAAFAKARAEQPKAPLLPEMQVVLAHLLKGSSDRARVQVPENAEELIAGALADHLKRAIKAVAESPALRAEVLLTLRDLATDDGKRGEGRLVQELEDALDAEILKRLTDDYRVLYRERREGRNYCLLSHDRIAEAVLEEMESPRIQEWLDAELVSLRRFVAAKAALLRHDPAEATSMSPENFSRVASHSKALLWDKNRKDWWSACQERIRRRIEELKTGLAGGGDPVQALRLVSELSDLGLARRDLSEQLEKRSDLTEVFEEGPALLPEKRRNAVLVAAADSCARFPPNRLQEDFDSGAPILGVLLWTLDSGPMRDEEASVVGEAREIRQSIVEFLRGRSPDLPKLAEDDWALITGGTFQMGSEADDAYAHERPVHTVEVSSFRLLKHQVTNAVFAALFGGRWASEAASKPLHPAVGMTWYQAYVFAAWLGGRLPTEAEWEYAARSGGKDRRYPWGDRTDDICERAAVKECGHDDPLPVGSLPKGNTEQGVSDMAGNVWEWVADWYRRYGSEAQKDPWGPVVSSGDRVLRGGSFGNSADRARASYRDGWDPWTGFEDQGFRVLLPAAPQPLNVDHRS